MASGKSDTYRETYPVQGAGGRRMIHYRYMWACADCGCEIEESYPEDGHDAIGEWCEDCQNWHPEVVMRRR